MKKISLMIAALAMSILTFLACTSSEEDPANLDIGLIIKCYPQGTYKGVIFSESDFEGPCLEVLDTPKEASDSLWPCRGDKVFLPVSPFSLYVKGDVFSFQFAYCERPYNVEHIWEATIDISSIVKH